LEGSERVFLGHGRRTKRGDRVRSEGAGGREGLKVGSSGPLMTLGECLHRGEGKKATYLDRRDGKETSLQEDGEGDSDIKKDSGRWSEDRPGEARGGRGCRRGCVGGGTKIFVDSLNLESRSEVVYVAEVKRYCGARLKEEGACHW